MAMTWIWTGMVVLSLVFGLFTGNLDAVADGICKKLIFRHPHVFSWSSVSPWPAFCACGAASWKS